MQSEILIAVNYVHVTIKSLKLYVVASWIKLSLISIVVNSTQFFVNDYNNSIIPFYFIPF